MFAYDPHAFELHAVAAVASHPDIVQAFHWPNVPESVLLESGYFVGGLAEHRKERLRNGGYRDYGLDGIAMKRSGAFVGIQAKAYGPNSTITFSLLGTFMGAVNALREKNPESGGVLVHTPESRIENRLASNLRHGVANITSLSLPFAERETPPPANTDECDETRLVLRPYQARAVEDIVQNDSRVALYVSPCGTGKTVVIGSVLARIQPNIVVVASPLQMSAEQNASRLGPFLPDHKLVKAWSDACCTTKESVERCLGADGDRFLVSTTFKTLPIVAKVLADRDAGFCLIVDEAHNLRQSMTDWDSLSTWTSDSAMTGEDEEDFAMTGDDDSEMTGDGEDDENSAMTGDEDEDSAMTDSDDATTASDSSMHSSADASEGPAVERCLWRIIRAANRSILMTATPPVFLTDDNGDVAVAHRYSFAEAIADKAICDYRILIPEISARSAAGSDVADESATSNVAAKASFLASGMLETGARRCIVYCGSRAECAEFNAAFEQTCAEYYGVGAATSCITCDTPVRERRETLRAFREGPSSEAKAGRDESGEVIELRKTVLRVVSSVRILDESIDIPECDSVFMTKCSEGGSQSSARVVQRLCRATRVREGKSAASIFVWTLGSGDDSGLIRAFSLLRENDVDFANKVVAVLKDYDKKASAESREAAKATVAEFNDTFLVRAITLGQAWENRLGELKAFVAANGRLPKQSEKPLGVFVNNQRMNNKKGKLSSDQIAALESVPFWKWEEGDPFPENLAKILEFVAANGRLPKQSEKPLGVWVGNQRMNKKNGKLSTDQIAALESVPFWKWEEGDPFPENLAKMIAFVAANGRLPLTSEKPLGHWVGTQRTRKKSGDLSSDQIAQIETIPGWKWEEKDTFPSKLAKILAFVAANGRLPTHRDKPLGSWVSNQRMNKKKGKLSADQIAALDSVHGWKWEEDPFPENLAKILAFVAANGRLPTRRDKPLGGWVGEQRKNKKKGKLSADRIAALDSVPGWKWEEEDPFPENIAKMIAFVAANGRLPTRRDKPLGQWVGDQRKNKRKCKLSTDRIAALDSVPGWKWEEEDPFPENIAKILEFVAANGRLPTSSEKPLGVWVINQRMNNKNGDLSSDRIAALDAVPGWKWEEDPFHEKLAKILAFVAANGRLPTSSEKPLGYWVSMQRYNKKKGKLSPDRIAQIETIPGWKWEEEDPYPENLAKILAFVAANGRLPLTSEKPLGSWVSTQRHKKKYGKLSADMIAALEAISCWKWEAY